MFDQPFSWVKFYKNPLVGILRGYSPETIDKIAKVYLKSGFYTLEITMNTDGVGEIIKTLRADYPDLNIGAGTVCNLADFEKALEASAQFIVTPILDPEVIKECVTRNIPIFPGAFTPTEIYKAWSLGASAVKVFPATQLGPKYIKDVLAPLNKIKLLPTGGVSKDNVQEFFKAGAVGAGVGSTLFHKEYIQTGNYDALGEHFLQFKDKIESFL